MAFIERYVTATAAGGGVGSEADPWALSESVSLAAAGDRVNIKKGAYSVGALSMTNAGTILSPIVYRGYNTTIGDLEGTPRLADGRLDTTDYPVITATASCVPNIYNYLQDIYMTGSFNANIIQSTSFDFVSLISVKSLNSFSGTSAGACELDDSCVVLNCDMVCTGSTHDTVFFSDTAPRLLMSRFEGSSSTADLCQVRSGDVIGCAFVGSTSGVGLVIETTPTSVSTVMINNTFYGVGTAITFPSASLGTRPLVMLNNFCTDSGKWLDNLYTATSSLPIIEMNSRTRDVTALRTGLGDSLNIGEVTTDTGGPETDYVDAGNGDITLTSSSPGVDSGVGM